MLYELIVKYADTPTAAFERYKALGEIDERDEVQIKNHVVPVRVWTCEQTIVLVGMVPNTEWSSE